MQPNNFNWLAEPDQAPPGYNMTNTDCRANMQFFDPYQIQQAHGLLPMSFPPAIVDPQRFSPLPISTALPTRPGKDPRASLDKKRRRNRINQAKLRVREKAQNVKDREELQYLRKVVAELDVTLQETKNALLKYETDTPEPPRRKKHELSNQQIYTSPSLGGSESTLKSYSCDSLSTKDGDQN